MTPASSRTARPRRVLVAAAAVLVLAVGGVGGWAGSRLGSDSTTPTGSLASSMSDAVVRDLASPGVRRVVLTEQGSTTPVAVLLAAPDHDLVLPVNMPDLAPGDAMWLWGVDPAGVPVPLGDVVEPTDAGTVALGVREVNALPAARTDYERYAMSIEPGGAVPTVPTTVVASGQVRA